jgi:hypothetical protein
MKGGKSETRKKYMRKYYKSLHIQWIHFMKNLVKVEFLQGVFC